MKQAIKFLSIVVLLVLGLQLLGCTPAKVTVSQRVDVVKTRAKAFNIHLKKVRESTETLKDALANYKNSKGQPPAAREALAREVIVSVDKLKASLNNLEKARKDLDLAKQDLAVSDGELYRNKQAEGTATKSQVNAADRAAKQAKATVDAITEKANIELSVNTSGSEAAAEILAGGGSTESVEVPEVVETPEPLDDQEVGGVEELINVIEQQDDIDEEIIPEDNMDPCIEFPESCQL